MRLLHPNNLIGAALLAVSILGAAFGHTIPARAEPQPPADPLSANATQCLMEQNQPVMGFNNKVVCVKKEAVSWVR